MRLYVCTEANCSLRETCEHALWHEHLSTCEHGECPCGSCTPLPLPKTLGEKQSRFTFMIALLLLKAHRLGYDIRFVKEHPNHKRNSLHFEGLAKDFNLFRDGVYLTKTEEHTILGEYWESLGGSWGGRFSDGNHYSLTHGGVR